MKNRECQLEDLSNIGPCSYEKVARRVLEGQQETNESFLDCSRKDLSNLNDITIPGKTNTFIAWNSGINSTEDLVKKLENLIDLEGKIFIVKFKKHDILF